MRPVTADDINDSLASPAVDMGEISEETEAAALTLGRDLLASFGRERYTALILGGALPIEASIRAKLPPDSAIVRLLDEYHAANA